MSQNVFGGIDSVNSWLGDRYIPGLTPEDVIAQWGIYIFILYIFLHC